MEEAKSVDLSIVIVSYNVNDYLIKCLDSIYSFLSNSINFEIIIVDNDSKDESPEVIEKKFKNVLLIKNNFNAGFPAANNQAFRIAKGDFILMLNPDTELTDDSINKLYQFLKSDSSISIAGPKVLNTDGSLQQSVWRLPTIGHVFAESFHLKHIIKNKYFNNLNPNQTTLVDSVSGCCLMFRKDLFEKIGMLDENLFWIEDVDFCYRAKLKNLKTAYYPLSQIFHHSGKSVKANYNFAYYNKIFNFIKYYKKHFSFFQFLIVWIISFVHVFYKIILFGILAPFKSVAASKAKAYLYTFKFFFHK
jgi:GT2 family glycosyltransferase